jgi:hypothetical protein
VTERADHNEGADDDVPVRTVSPPPAMGEERIEAPVMDGAAELRVEAAEAIESGEVDLTDPRHGGPSVVEEDPGSEGREAR